MDDIKSESLNGIYKDMAEVLGVQVVMKIYKNYKGLQITFPIRLLSSEYVKREVTKEYDGTNTKLLARKFEYSERWIRKMIKEGEIEG
jgi:Mor family transcriptional regulator